MELEYLASLLVIFSVISIIVFLVYDSYKNNSKTIDEAKKNIEISNVILENLDLAIKSEVEESQPKNKWQQFVEFCQNNKTFSRQDVLNSMPSEYKDYTCWDEYRCILMKAGYIEYDKTKKTKAGRQKLGFFKIKREISSDLTYREARRKAYGKKKTTKSQKKKSSRKRRTSKKS